ncbi:putative zinc-binding metallopeptidase [Zoogloea sp. 1C4]|uniref:zinc-binding metallopeptidase family protein n=1 Tax=Zoogloea sp. 1C4 TaxID=2570190 RepID=UPI001290FE3D|nr:putative zinc-binding metallopeptidase [Zoogloea sp. 1C4]
MKTFRCSQCDQPVYFENTACAACGVALGYLPSEAAMAAFEAAPEGPWKALGKRVTGKWKPCANYTGPQVCNWMVPADDPADLCSCCRQTEVIPTLEKPDNRLYWARLEAAKRRLYYALDTLGLDRPGLAEDPERGLRFQFLEAVEGGDPVLTGHDSGCITVNIAEADDAEREARRTAMGEPYRSLLGHFRHEIGHYYWDALVAQGGWLEPYRALFGDERADYAQALETHYRDGSRPDWPAHFISAYAASHPWEDWAETWAHYLHVVDALDTADHWGLHLDGSAEGPAAADPGESFGKPFRERLTFAWLPLSRFLNSMSRSLGHGDVYPFVLPDPVLDKLAFVDEVVRSANGLAWRDWPPVPRE